MISDRILSEIDAYMCEITSGVYVKMFGQSHAEDCIRPILYFSKF
jgi:hypothetical protein